MEYYDARNNEYKIHRVLLLSLVVNIVTTVLKGVKSLLNTDFQTFTTDDVQCVSCRIIDTVYDCGVTTDVSEKYVFSISKVTKSRSA